MPAYPLTCIRFSLGCISFVKIPGQRSRNDRLYGSSVAFDPPDVQRGIAGRTDRQKRESVKYRDSNLTGTYWTPLTTGGAQGADPIGRRICTSAIISHRHGRHGFPYILERRNAADFGISSWNPNITRLHGDLHGEKPDSTIHSVTKLCISSLMLWSFRMR